MKRISMLVVLLLTLLLTVSNGAYAGTPKSAELSPKHGDIVTQQDASSLSGKVIETMNSGGYTYCNIERNGKKIWVAVPETQVKAGQTLSFQPGMPMENFESKTLHRTFDTIIFSGGIMEQGSGAAAEPAGHKKAEAPAAKAIKVKKASGANAYTVAELYQKRGELDKKEVVVRGQVVKVSAEIMGKNWIHIQDGTGDASKGTDDILVTSKDLPSVGDTVTAKGTLAKDKDFGSGYKYSVIVEEGDIKK
ncbi:MAG: DNA-binding protein [Nitrospirae bacterium]|nr:DNA-binding protein [Nitrospirota bacterium]